MYLAVVAAHDPTIGVDPELLARIQQHVGRREDDLARPTGAPFVTAVKTPRRGP